MNNLLIAQSGGPTVAINATLVGILEGAKTSSKIGGIYGAINGIEGVIQQKFIALDNIVNDTETMGCLCQTPAAALGSCRFRLGDWKHDDTQYKQIVESLVQHSIRYFIYIGGNDSMDTVNKLASYLEKEGNEDIIVIGAPKTIDNDLAHMDHCPGFGSAAKYVATTCLEIERDIAVYDTSAVTIIEVMGRNTGWLTAASALARLNGGAGPSLIYLCERAFDVERFIQDVRNKLKEKKSIMVVVSEGLKNSEGKYISEQVQCGIIDEFGHDYIAGVGQVLAQVIRENIQCKVRGVELNLMQRSSAHIASEVDLRESKMVGMKALQCAVEENRGTMGAIKRIASNPYQIEFVAVPVVKVANLEKKVPLNFINEAGNDVTEEMMVYLTPLIQGESNIRYKNGIPKHLILYPN